jgi:hypothetical protein
MQDQASKLALVVSVFKLDRGHSAAAPAARVVSLAPRRTQALQAGSLSAARAGAASDWERF